MERPLTINLATALRLAGAEPIDINLASRRLEAASAQLDRSKVLWLPTVVVGGDYLRHDGQIQDVRGEVFGTSKSALLGGAGPVAVFAVTDAIYQPLAARQIVRARQGDVEAARNDSVLAVAEAFFSIQQARGEIAGAIDAERRTQELVKRTERLAEGLTPSVEINRAKTELARRRQALESSRERWQVTSAQLTRLLRLNAAALVEPVEDPHLVVRWVDLSRTVDELIPIALTHRPELAARQALVEATLTRLKQEKLRPLMPSILLRGAGTNPAGTLSSGVFGGGLNDHLGDFRARNSIDLQVLWEFQNLGLGNHALVRERKAENQQAVLELFRTQDIIAAEVVQAHAQAERAANRIRDAEDEVENARITAEKVIDGLSQTRRVGESLVLVFRPLEAVTAVQALDQAYRDYYGAIADANRAQVRLYRAIGRSAECVPADVSEAAPVRLLPPVSP